MPIIKKTGPVRVPCHGFDNKPTTVDIVATVCDFVQMFQYEHESETYTFILELGWYLSAEDVAAVEAELRKDTGSLRTRLRAKLVSKIHYDFQVTGGSELQMDIADS